MSSGASLKTLALTTLMSTTLLYATAASAVPQSASKDEKGYYASGRLLIKAKPGMPEGKFTELLAKHAAKAERKIKGAEVHVVNVPPGLEKKVLAELSTNPGVEFVEMDRAIPAGFTPNDPSFGSQWHHTKIGSSVAWDGADASNIVVAILDSGVDGTHPDLAGSMLTGWNVVSQNTDTTDINGHGTAVAGTAAAIFNNGTGVSGMARGAKILPVRITNDSTTYAYWSDIANGVIWAADHGAKVVNNSYGSHESSSVSSAASYLKGKGGQLFTSAMNNGTAVTFASDPNIITVSATDGNDVKASWSNYGPVVDISAPGVSILTTSRGGAYQNWNGTSFSAPMTAGLAALVFAVNPAFTPNDVENILKGTAQDLGTASRDDLYGYGRINAASAVSLAQTYTPTVVDTTAPTTSITTPGNGGTVNGVVSVNAVGSDNVGVSRVDLLVNGAVYATDTSAPYSFAWDTTALGNTTRTLTTKAYDAAGNVGASANVGVTVKNIIDTTAPTAAITSPANGVRISGTVNIQATGSDNVGIASMALAIDGKQVATSATGAISYNWNTRKVTAGTHTILVTATDTSGNKGQTSISVTK